MLQGQGRAGGGGEALVTIKAREYGARGNHLDGVAWVSLDTLYHACFCICWMSPDALYCIMLASVFVHSTREGSATEF